MNDGRCPDDLPAVPSSVLRATHLPVGILVPVRSSERLVQRALGTIPADRTAVIITHRLSTVEIADWVLVLEHSQILENGSPAELEAQGGRYVGLHKPGRSHLPDGDVSEAHPESRRRD